MTVFILSKQNDDAYENERLKTSFLNKNIPAMIVNPDQFDIVVNRDIRQGLHYQGRPIDLPKLLLVRTGAGTNSFTSAVIEQFEQAGVTCINSLSSTITVKDKLRTSQILTKHGVAIPNTMLVRWPLDHDIVHDKIGWPCIVKVITGSHGDGIYLCEKKKDFKKLMGFIDSLKTRRTLILQEYLGEQPGVDLRVLVIGGKVIGAMKRTAPDGDFRANISAGGMGESYEITEEIDYIARETAKVLGLDIAGIDLLFDSRGFRVCEANSSPGFNGFEKYCSTDVADLITEYVKFKIQ
jgi:glutathione synthase/RimK-type ligase-like ATP-grasp enzyme